MVFDEPRQGTCSKCGATQAEIFEDSLASKAHLTSSWRCRPCWDKVEELRQILALHKEQMKEHE